jgi:hypothetical protein
MYSWLSNVAPNASTSRISGESHRRTPAIGDHRRRPADRQLLVHMPDTRRSQRLPQRQIALGRGQPTAPHDVRQAAYTDIERGHEIGVHVTAHLIPLPLSLTPRTGPIDHQRRTDTDHRTKDGAQRGRPVHPPAPYGRTRTEPVATAILRFGVQGDAHDLDDVMIDPAVVRTQYRQRCPQQPCSVRTARISALCLSFWPPASAFAASSTDRTARSASRKRRATR